MKQKCWACGIATAFDMGLDCSAGRLRLCRFCADALYDKALERKRALESQKRPARAKRADLATDNEVADLLAMKGCGRNDTGV